MRTSTHGRQGRRPSISGLRPLALCVLLLVGAEREARAYTDPGTGALLWQLLAAGLVSALFYFRRLKSWVKAKMKGKE